MLSLLTKFFGRPPAPVPAPPIRVLHHVEPSAPVQAVDVAHLSLAAILARLPEELRPLVLKQPDDAATVTLPVATIVKQLPAGAVKVSLATVHRQAPAGVFGPLPPGDKRMVDVPLAEVFRHLKPSQFKRRADQRPAPALGSKFNLFGDAQNPYHLAPTAPDDAPEPAASLPAPEMPAVAEKSEPDFQLARQADPVPSAQRVIAPPPDFFEPKLRKLPAAPAPDRTPPGKPEPARATISIAVEPLAAGWPEPIRHELAVLNGSARVALPTDDVTAGLARGKVTFTWGQIRPWIEPALGESNADAATELTLPLKVVAPVFLAATRKPKLEQRPAELDLEIPALFSDARAANAVSEPALEPPEPADFTAPPPAAVPTAAPPTLSIADAPADVPAPASAREIAPAPRTMGELFGDAAKTEWTPAEIVAQLAKLPSVAGAIVALQEGLLVAHSLPGEVRSEVIAAFLPQLFARLNQYAGEMKLGDVDDLLFTTHGAHCQIYRLGYVYFAVLGQPGEPLPWTALRLVADELARQTQHS
jgi:predicted regulator of Ras-like GTPase activity (Roadblock/LC7/MglB family)